MSQSYYADIMISICIHFATNILVTFFFIDEQYSIMYMCYDLYIHLLMDNQSGPILAIAKNSVKLMNTQVSLRYVDINYFRYTHKSDADGTYCSVSGTSSLISQQLHSLHLLETSTLILIVAYQFTFVRNLYLNSHSSLPVYICQEPLP